MNSRIIPTILAGVFCLATGSASADSSGMNTTRLAEEKKCTACHGISETGALALAPSFLSIAQRYSMEESGRLVNVVQTGGEDHWGNAEMPEMGARTDVSRNEAEKLVNWILAMDQTGH